ncbi:hypothetical protein EX895_005548 [Sporisorium graminicola]|uniref:Uncharacterized protein n=1 Tax=Sporisorium graminicola TaxID=280036 RepID=A0A4U7KNA6_9BASI|nr:hypothetical protein EX895_005548 [Sporisorium graminicola]TKY85386.1 hypothetical protein EX895_005548 [Sporisorium graminicola]
MVPIPTSSADEAKTDITTLPTASDDVMASCLESIHSLPQASADAHSSQKTHFDHATSWMASNNDISGQLALSDFRNPDLSSISKPLGLTPGALGLTGGLPGSSAGGDGWSISPWINMAPTPSASLGSDLEQSSLRSQVDSQCLDTGMTFEQRSSLASRRGFSGSLKLETRAS